MNLDDALKTLTTGIYIVTSKQGTEINGMIASWVSQVSFCPPLIMVAVKRGRRTHSMIEEGKVFSVNVLDNTQEKLVSLFKNRNKPGDTCLPTPYEIRKTGTPTINDSLAYLECKLISQITPGDHTIFIGEVIEGALLKKGTPLSSNDLQSTYGGVGY
jgi:flavin reductase (DIM6/NTAB) family NADH-FMN oxidoreductase RutF